MASTIDVTKFYGKLKVNKNKADKAKRTDLIPFRSVSLLTGPPLTWKVFKFQSEAMEFASSMGHGLMPFVFQTGKTRLFLVAHPIVFWHYDSQRPLTSRCTYEIIRENTVCKLYFDIEYDVTINPNKNGYHMVSVFVKLISHFLKSKYKCQITDKDVLILDSTTPTKFSQHLIFPGIIFLNNYLVGSFVNFINNSLVECIENSLGINEITHEEISTLCIKTKCDTKIFFDQCVYSKNRHFRLFGSCKKNKNVPLICTTNQYFQAGSTENTFLASLITYVNGNDNTKIIQNDDFSPIVKSSSASKLPRMDSLHSSSSPYPDVDSFISKVVSPGRIYRTAYFSATSSLVYDIVGNRYCGNIKRPHKSNNIKYIVNLTTWSYYQKCHDRECCNYRSEVMSLPNEICFALTDHCNLLESHENIGVFDLTDGDLQEVLNAVEDVVVELAVHEQISPFPSFGLSDDVFTQLDY